MDSATIGTIVVVVVVALALIVGIVVLRNRGNLSVEGKGPLGSSMKVSASDPAPPTPGAARISDSESRTGAATALSRGGNAEISGTKAEKDLRAEVGGPDGSPKAGPPA
jgi:hypothetical protein